MRTFDRNLNAYHARNALNDYHMLCLKEELAAATTPEEIMVIHEESSRYFEEQRKYYKELREEGVI